MSDSKPHKFTHNSNNASHYASLIYCEYCGFVVFNGNSVKEDNEKRHVEAQKGCPLNPLYPSTYNRR